MFVPYQVTQWNHGCAGQLCESAWPKIAGHIQPVSSSQSVGSDVRIA